MKDSQAIVTPLGVSGVSIKLDSPEWFSWLSERSSFSYQSAISDYTCNKRSNGKWYASKRKGDRSQGSKSLAQEYLGSGDKVTKTKLEEIARKFALPDRDYWYLKHPKPKTGEPTASPGAGCTTDKGTTKNESSSQTADEIAELKAEVERLKNRETYLLDQLGLVKTKIIHESQTEVEALKTQLNQTDKYNMELERNYSILNEMWRKSEQQRCELQARLNECQAHQQPSVDAATLFNQLRPLLNRLSDRDRRAIQQKLEEIVD